MSRKWERMVAKNQKTANKRRVKSGAELVRKPGGTEELETFKGRSWMFPLMLIAFGVSNLYLFGRLGQLDRSYLITFFLYVALGLFIFWIRRPILRIGKSRISSRRFGGDKTVEAGEVEEILLAKNAIVIQLKQGRRRWVYTRVLQWFPIADVSARLREYAARNGVKLVEG